MAKFTDYTQKTKPADADLLLIHDNAGAANKKTPFSGVWSWILDKLASAVISQLQTENKSIIPAINELNSKTNNINGHILISFVNATDTIKIQTKFDSIPTSGAMRQSIFMFGTANGTTVYGMITLFSNTPLNSRWDGVGKVGVNIDSNGIVTITLPQTSYDRFILISSEKIAGL